MTMFWVGLLACFPSIRESEEERFIDNPQHDFDGDTYTEEQGDCDDRNPEVHPGPNNPEKCDTIDNDCNGIIDDNAIDTQVYYYDEDGDGFGIESVSEQVCPFNRSDDFVMEMIRNGEVTFDCNDNNPSVNPDQKEECFDNLDNDCDGVVDNLTTEPAPIWYYDGDGDSFGDIHTTERRCTPSSGYVRNFDDCDDNDAMIHPYVPGLSGGVELCDELEVDENCNGIANEASAKDASIWYFDDDNDGYGDTYTVQPACTQPEQYVSEAGDCDDQDSGINPLMTETCNAVDDDCDGLIDEGADSTAPIGASTFYADSDGDGYGDPNATLIQCELSLGFISDNTDCKDDSAAVNPNASEYCNAVDDDCDGSIDEEDALDQSQWYADFDGDGYGTSLDTVVVCPYNKPVGYIEPSMSLDCDDANPNTYPTAVELCDGVDNDCDGLIDDADINDLDITLGPSPGSIYYVDADGDSFGDTNIPVERCTSQIGYVLDNTDCNDADGSVNPTSDEVCDGVDNDCDALIDDSSSIDQSPFYQDGDGDGYGDPNVVVQQCITIPLVGFVNNNFDCDDTNSQVNPNSIWYLDADGDLYGNPDIYFQSCIPPMSYIDIDGDCNDLDAEVYPSAIEVCDGKLNRCEDDDGQLTPPIEESDLDEDGYVSCTVTSLLDWDGDAIFGGGDCDDSDEDEHPNAVWYLDEDSDGYGRTGIILAECEQPTGYSSIDGDCNDSSEFTYPGAAPLTDPLACLTDFDGNGEADRSWGFCNSVQDETEARFSISALNPGTQLGTSVSLIGDVDGDGLDDILVGNPYEGRVGYGEVYLFYSSSLPFNGPLSASEADVTITGLWPNQHFGLSVASAGDIDGDGLDDILVNSQGGGSRGRTSLFLGSSLQGASSIDTDAADYTFEGLQSTSYAYGIASAGDVDGDGLDDILIGAYGNDDAAQDAGAVYIFLGASLDPSQPIDLLDADYILLGEEADHYAGSVASAGDVDGDGLDDILVGAYGGHRGYLILGASLFSTPTIDLSQADVIFEGEDNMVGDVTYFGEFLSSAGDVDGDGLDDILISAPRYGAGNNESMGRVYLFLANSFGSLSAISASSASYIFEGVNYWHRAGISVSSAGDIDGDGLDDIIIGERRTSSYAYLLKGSSLGATVNIPLTNSDFVFGPINSMNFGGSVSGGGDIDGDGLDDIIIGAPGDNSDLTGGSAFVFSACEN